MLATNYLTSLFIHLLWLNYLAKYMTMHASTLFIHITTRCIWAPISGVARGTMQFIYFTMQIKECITSQRRRWWSGRRPSASRRTGLTHDVLFCHHISVHGRAQLLGDPGTAGGGKRVCRRCQCLLACCDPAHSAVRTSSAWEHGMVSLLALLVCARGACW